MELSHIQTKDKEARHHHYKMFGRDGSSCANYRVIILCLGLLNAVLIISAVVLGVSCARIKENSLQVSHSAASQLIGELTFLRSNHSDVIEAKEEAKRALDMAIKNHTQLKEQIKQQEIMIDGYQRQLKALRAEKTSLQANISALDGSCGRCPSGWTVFNSSCYFFSYTESSSRKKNWNDSRADCLRRGSDLIVIDNQEEQKFVSHTIEDMKSGRDVWSNGFWIGLTDMDAEGTWTWINNVTEVESRYWMDMEPNNLHNGEDCAVATYGPENPWKTRYDARCMVKQLQWICETEFN
ncbi:CD209 antigen-like protein C [Kryptolebias marmoratus]|uniref:CD209 antigen-like protein C n=1 Tax=Kryptolebias marmoratus TaxID=37003 RepID=A0A3Q2ZJ93_KRYMA|nr:CD209 antigen-like protein C [Kryptolebias marmoratus]